MDEKRLFGEIAIEQGLIDHKQLLEALDRQIKHRRAGRGHKLLGIVLVELGYMTPETVFEVLQAFEDEQRAPTRPQPGAGVVSVSFDERGRDDARGTKAGSITDTVPLDSGESSCSSSTHEAFEETSAYPPPTQARKDDPDGLDAAFAEVWGE